jgi:hypothetical protein
MDIKPETAVKTPDKTAVKTPDKTAVKTPDKTAVKTPDKEPETFDKELDKTAVKTPDKEPETTSEPRPINKSNHKAIYKIFPSTYPNNKGSYVGKEYIHLLKDPSFMDNFDDVDFYMNALFKNMVNDLTDEKTGNKKTPRSILPYFEKVIQFDPTIYTKNGGKKSRKRHRKTSTRNKRNKKQKRRTYKKKK